MRIAANGIDLAIWEWPGDDPPILFVHATGFHGRCWDQIVRALPGRRALAIDLRGHGRSQKPAPPFPWRIFGHDVAESAELLGLRGAVGVGHSLGGHAITLAAALRPEIFSSLLLIDPVIQPPNRYTNAPTDVAFIARRRSHWNSVEEMFERFRSRPPFANWRPEVLRDYCEYGLLPAPDGEGLILACPPEIEAAIYPESKMADADIHAEVRTIRQPVIVMRSGSLMTAEKFDLSSSATDPTLASEFANGRDVYLAGRSHFIPMENPELIVEYIRNMSDDRHASQ